MSSEARTAGSARTSADLSGRDCALTFAGLLDVLDRADSGLVAQRTRPRRSAASRPAGSRSGVRTVPLRSVQPAPMARTVRSTPASVPGPARPTAPAGPPRGGIRLVSHRIALWGSGPEGEYLAWRCPAPRTARRRFSLRALVRRAALWGAGPTGEYLAWGGASRPAPAGFPPPLRDLDGPVVLRELPSTPTIQPAAPSPAAAQLPRGPASNGPRGMPPVPRGAVAVPGMRPSGPPERSLATGWPSPARPSPAATGLVRARGDPLACPARGSPP
jgi:hypothetical protein